MWRSLRWSCFIMAMFFSFTALAQTEGRMNFSDRRSIIINNCPFIQLSDFNYHNAYDRSIMRLRTNLSWRNAGDQPIVAFEVVVLRYDPFNRPIYGGGRWLITGNNSADWRPLMPGRQSSDGLIGHDEQPVLTSVVYVRAARLADGAVWMFDEPAIEQRIREELPALHEIGDVNPAPSETAR